MIGFQLFKKGGVSRKNPHRGGVVILASLTSERSIKTTTPEVSLKSVIFLVFIWGGVFISARLRKNVKKTHPPGGFREKPLAESLLV